MRSSYGNVIISAPALVLPIFRANSVQSRSAKHSKEWSDSLRQARSG